MSDIIIALATEVLDCHLSVMTADNLFAVWYAPFCSTLIFTLQTESTILDYSCFNYQGWRGREAGVQTIAKMEVTHAQANISSEVFMYG